MTSAPWRGQVEGNYARPSRFITLITVTECTAPPAGVGTLRFV